MVLSTNKINYSLEFGFLKRLLFSIFNTLGNYPFVVELYTSVRRGQLNKFIISSQTNICVEGPPGCANSFFVQGLLMSNPYLKVAHHLHYPSQVIMAQKMSIPCIVLLRKPEAAVLTRASRVGHKMIDPLFDRWINFFCAIEGDLQGVTVVSFETATNNPGKVIEKINSDYSFEYNVKFPTSNDVMEAIKLNEGGGVEPVIPDMSREKIKENIRSLVQKSPKLAKANRIYDRLILKAI